MIDRLFPFFWCREEQGSTALLWASSGGSLEVVEWLVKQGGANAGHRNKVGGGVSRVGASWSFEI